ncbi:cyclin-dependent kinase 2-interacting protein-like [Schistocerca nitens]|uniref:cyclin-dependent kinase 2-interacting protein-like n=1 Tax=Schistocerca nitens TaxID=7011 RepID=UPI0021188BF7|nr:cyclin-dependent kinase 2-interacting protein-like [Schistocerca nitens]
MEPPAEKSVPPPTFTPIVLSDSPVKSTPQKGNLTGNARVIRDLVADMYNWVQAWNRHHKDGYKILKSIADLKIPALKESHVRNCEPVYPDGLQPLINDLTKVCDMLDATLTGMREVAQKMDAVVSLEKLHNEDNTPLFLTWDADKFGESCHQICTAFNRELEVKQDVVSEISHCDSEPELMLHLAAWVYQPHVTSIDDRVLEALLVETGHK